MCTVAVLALYGFKFMVQICKRVFRKLYFDRCKYRSMIQNVLFAISFSFGWRRWFALYQIPRFNYATNVSVPFLKAGLQHYWLRATVYHSRTVFSPQRRLDINFVSVLTDAALTDPHRVSDSHLTKTKWFLSYNNLWWQSHWTEY